MKILLISSDNNRTSGAFLCLVELANNLRYYYQANVLVVLPKRGDGEVVLDELAIPHVYIPSFSWISYEGYGIKAILKYGFKQIMRLFNLYAIYKIGSLIQREHIDLVHTNTIFAYVGAIAANKVGCKHVWHLRECIHEGHSSRIVMGNKGYRLIGMSDVILAVSNMVRSKYQKHLPYKKIITLYDGVSERFYQEREILRNEKVCFTCIGALVPNKKQRDLIQAVARLADKDIENFVLQLVGTGGQEKELREMVKLLGVADKVDFLGARDDIVKILDDTDVLCSASGSEAFGRTIVEGMLHGCLALCARSSNSAAAEILDGGKAGVLYSCGDIDALSEAMQDIISCQYSEKYRAMAVTGQKRSKMMFTSRENAKSIWNVYCRMMGR